MPLTAVDGPAAKRQAIETVLHGIQMQPGGPTLFFGEPQGSMIAVLEHEVVEGGRFR